MTLCDPSAVVAAFGTGVVVHAGDDLAAADYLAVLADMPDARAADPPLAGPEAAESPALLASAARIPAGGAAPDEAAEQGRVRRPGPLPQPKMTQPQMTGADGYDYSRWDGTQDHLDLDPDDLLAELTDDLLAGGDLDDAYGGSCAVASRRRRASG